jgi:dihydrofolate synthase / folylpolyglutamate synthase
VVAAVTYAEAERYLLSLELFGMRFGLDRMRRLMTVLGSPQERFGTVHVAGTNGKSSTVRMTAAILARHGLRTGSYLSPHLVAFNERIRIDDTDLSPDRFAAAVARAARAAEKVNRTLEEGDRVTQFEALTAAAYSEIAEQGADVAVVEAGLGGRWDATNVIPSKVQVLTNVGLEHTRWLGPTIADIAAEKLDIVRPGGTLVVGAGLHPDAMALAERVCAERGATLVVAAAHSGLELLARGEHQQRNFAVARAAAEAYHGPLDERAVREAGAATLVPGRFQLVDERPVTIIDGAHNAAGMAALAQSLRTFAEGRRLVAVVSVLDDKDAAGMLRELLPLCSEVVFTQSANPRALPAGTLESLSGQLGGPPARTAGEPRRAVAAARDAAGPDGVVVATGSIYLIADLLRPEGVRGRSMM